MINSLTVNNTFYRCSEICSREDEHEIFRLLLKSVLGDYSSVFCTFFVKYSDEKSTFCQSTDDFTTFLSPQLKSFSSLINNNASFSLKNVIK